MGIIKSTEIVLSDVFRLRYLFVNMYMVGTRENWVLVDAGLEEAEDAIIEAAEARFGKGARPGAIILTHGHFDHIGALGDLLEEWNVPVYAHALELPYLSGQADYPEPDPGVGGGMMARMSFAFPHKGANFAGRIKPLPADGTVPGMPEWNWIHTPGHAEGHISLFRQKDRCLIAGDAFVTTRQESFLSVSTQKEGVYGPPTYFTPDWNAARRSVQLLASLEPAVALAGHGRPMRGEALTKGLHDLATRFDMLAIPRKGKYVSTAGLPPERNIGAEEAEWLHHKLNRTHHSSDLPDVASAPLGTDQEAGGAITTPSGKRYYS